jgi:cell division protein FtsI/penicillin-binding protein 2
MSSARIDRRIRLIFVTFIVLLAAALLRATYLGTVQASALQTVAVEQQITEPTVPALRGAIFDRKGTALAVSEPVDNVVADPRAMRGAVASDAAALAPLLHLSVPALADAVAQVPGSGYLVIGRQVPIAEGQQVLSRVDALHINGIGVQSATKRVYPFAWEASQVLGGVQYNWNDQLVTGANGIEYEDDRTLAGQRGELRIVRDERGQDVSVQTIRRVVPGSSLTLTLDAGLEHQVESVLEGVGAKYRPSRATAIAMNPDTGAILALANWPRIDANDPGGSPATYSKDLAIAYNYEPGSTFKAITVAAALQDGLVNPGTELDVPDELHVYNRVIHDAEPHPTEMMSVAHILKVSSNIGAVLIGRLLGPYRFNAWVHQFGFGSPTGVDLPGEEGGIILPLSGYTGATMANLPFGQGESVTPIQMATAYSAIANGGILRPPHIVQAIGDRTLPEPRGHRIISTTTASELRQMLIGVLGDGGTASGAAIPGWQMAGKTGTANIAVDGHYSRTRFAASFIGMVPADAPKLVVAVTVWDPHGSIYGGSVAAPAFRKIVGWAVPYLGISPH